MTTRPAAAALPATVTRAGLIALAGIAVCIAYAHFFGARYLYEWDSVNFALGADRYDVSADQPHAPGYILWILLMRLVTKLGADVNSAQILLSCGFTILALGCSYALARSWYGPRIALLASMIFITSPLVLLYGAVALNYPVDLFTSSALALLAYHLAKGDCRAALPAWGLLALTAGVRPSGSLYLVPLVAVSTVLACRRRPALAVLALAVGGAVGLAWLIPTVVSAGGWQKFLALCRSQSSDSFTLTSVLFGATWGQQATTVLKAVLFLGMALGGPLIVLVALVSARVLARGSGSGSAGAPAGAPAGVSARRFFGLWLIPAMAVLLLVHCPKPGYVLVLLPGFALLLAVGIAGALQTLPKGISWLAAAATLALLNLVLFLAPYDALLAGRMPTVARLLGHCGRESVRRADRSMERVLSVVRDPRVPAQCDPVISFGGFFGTDYRAPNWRKLSYYLPGYKVGYVGSESHEAAEAEPADVTGPGETGAIGTVRTNGERVLGEFELDACARQVWWIVGEPGLRQTVLDQFPGTLEEPLAGGYAALRTSIPPGSYDHALKLPDGEVRIRRR